MRNAKSLDISGWLKDEINKEARITAIKLLQGVVLNTAVDTGILRGSWLVSVESPNYSIPNSDDKSGAGTISRGVNIIGTAQTTDYPTIYIQSRYPYAYRIMELGYSTQTPPKELTKQIKRATNL
ncbi:hypothetical protein [Pseudoalteromonas sp.]|uniref:hypothetical protein n=1 Tax=Pseudoalteromonas sp. TaxID=53249 RepID=UPI003D12D79C